MALAYYYSATKNQMALTNIQYEAIKKFLEAVKARDLCKDKDEKLQLMLKLQEIRQEPTYGKHWKNAYSLTDDGKIVGKNKFRIGDYYKTFMQFYVQSDHMLS